MDWDFCCPDLTPAVERKYVHVPPELLLEIFNYATWIPGATTTTNHHAIVSFTRDRYGLVIHKWFKESLKTKLALSSVCKNFNLLSQRFLFDYILINSGAQALRVSERLERDYPTLLPTFHPRCWTKRLEIALEGVHTWTEKQAKAAARAILSCPNLAVFSTAFSTVDSAHLFRFPALIDGLSRTTRTLKRLEVRADTILIKELVSVLAPSLEVLWILPSRVPRMFKESALQTLPKLRILISTFTTQSPLRIWHLPHVHTFFVDAEEDLLTLPYEDGCKVRHILVPTGFTAKTNLVLAKCQDLSEMAISMTIENSEAPLFQHIGNSVFLRSITFENSFFLRPFYVRDNEEWARTFLNELFERFTSRAKFPVLERIRFSLPFSVGRQEFAIFLQVCGSWFKRSSSSRIQIQISQGSDDRVGDKWYSLARNDSFL